MTSIKVGDIDLDAFHVLSIEIGCVISVITSVVSRWGLITYGFHFGQSLFECLKGDNLAFISANIIAICWGSIGAV